MKDNLTYEELAERLSELENEIRQIKSWNPLYGKRIYFLGSSWTYGLGCEGKDNFAMRIPARNRLEYFNQSVSTTTYVLREGRQDSYYERAERFPQEKPDYVLLQLSSNDPRHTDCPVGHAAEFYAENPEQGQVFDLHTIAGAMEGTISKLMRRWPGAKFAWYTGFRGPIVGDDKAKQRSDEVYHLLIDEIAPKWGTPVCDLSLQAGLNTFIDENRVLLTTGDGQHCISAGYSCWETALESFLKSL
ncbi:MAG: SGNH/GDSL hydrolase family protein [Solobacterium sp.]|nr:SGNH/GDSL hydrolase family protein [Solobacterium sp.]